MLYVCICIISPNDNNVHFHYSTCQEALRALNPLISLSLMTSPVAFGFNLNWQAQLFCMQGGDTKGWVNPLWFPAAVTHTVWLKATKCSWVKPHSVTPLMWRVILDLNTLIPSHLKGFIFISVVITLGRGREKKAGLHCVILSQPDFKQRSNLQIMFLNVLYCINISGLSRL